MEGHFQGPNLLPNRRIREFRFHLSQLIFCEVKKGLADELLLYNFPGALIHPFGHVAKFSAFYQLLSQNFGKNPEGFYFPAPLPLQYDEQRVRGPENFEKPYKGRGGGGVCRQEVEDITLQLQASNHEEG
jgi:hypothetical protein